MFESLGDQSPKPLYIHEFIITPTRTRKGKKRYMTITNSKVVGTTFHPIPNDNPILVNAVYEKDGVPCAKATVVLQPEPDNPYDSDAVKVIVKLVDGTAFHLGYIGKNDPLKTQIKKLCVATMEILDYRSIALNVSYKLLDIQM